MDVTEIKDQADEIAARGDRFNRAIAIAVVVVAVFLAICQVKSGNTVQAMQAAQVEKLDNWNFFQAKSTKQNLFELEVESWDLRRKTGQIAGTGAEAAFTTQIENWKSEVDRYEREKNEIKAKAEQAEKDYDSLGKRDDQFDLSETLLGLSLALFALSSLSKSRSVFSLGLLIAGLGVLMGIAGFFAWPIHPSVVKFLS